MGGLLSAFYAILCCSRREVTASTPIQRTCADKFLGLGGCHPDVLKIGDEWGGHVLIKLLNMGLFFF